jgi:hypothetical protein
MAADPVYDLIENQKPTRAPGRCSVIGVPWSVIGGPWCAIRDSLSLVSCARNTVHESLLMDHGALLRAPGSCALGDFIGIGWKGTRIPGNEMLLAMKKAAI